MDASERRRSSGGEPRGVHTAVVLAALAPLVWLAWAFWSDLTQDTRHLSSEPIKEMEHFTGKWALRFLLLSLAITPTIRHLGLGWLIRFRRSFGLLGFTYALVHLSIYFGLDIELNWALLTEDVLDRIYITLGMTALVLLIPLAATSSKAAIRKLGSRRWKALHRLVYVAVVLGSIHFYMAVKRDVREPLVYMLIMLALFALRWTPAERRKRQRGALRVTVDEGSPGR